MEVSGQLHALAALPLGQVQPAPNEQKAQWAPELVCTFWTENLLLPLVIKTQIIQLVD
jgi:hypothetical protein